MTEKRRVPLYLGEGPDRVKIGTAEVVDTEIGLEISAELLGWRFADEIYGHNYPCFKGLVPKKHKLFEEENSNAE